MSLLINLRHLEHKDIELQGDLPAAELELDGVDELIKVSDPIQYKLEAQRLDQNLLVHGTLHARLDCECARCLKSFKRELDFSNWTVHLPLAGEEKVEITSDCVDLTPYIREDILLAFPQHPLCESECGGLKDQPSIRAQSSNGTDQIDETSSAWAELNKLKF
jgi:uncharacterized protein